MGRAVGLFLPGTVGLDGYRLVESAAYTGEVIKCTTVVAVEKLIGIVALGNFDEQFPSDAQLEALNRHVHRLMRAYRVPVSRVLTHQEWSATACPGKHLQRYLVDLRENGELGAKVTGSRGREGAESRSQLTTQ